MFMTMLMMKRYQNAIKGAVNVFVKIVNKLESNVAKLQTIHEKNAMKIRQLNELNDTIFAEVANTTKTIVKIKDNFIHESNSKQ